MGKTTGFMEYTRREAGHRPEAERIADWRELTLPQDAAELHLQSARCMDCGVPFCHSGFVVEGLSIGCPLCGLIPEINDLVYRGDLAAAWARLCKTHPFPEITSRVCPALCEGSCTLGEHAQPVTVRGIERWLADTMLAAGAVVPRVPARRSGRSVAVVGSGPAGLACADALNQLGERVTVFEKSDRPGGLLMYGIPNMKLDKRLVQNRADLLAAEGIRFELGCDVAGGDTLSRLIGEYDAVVLCAGAGAARPVQAPGAQLAGVVPAVAYLTAATRALLDGTPAAESAAGRDVVVLGGGDTGTDCVATAIRQGARSVTQLEIMPPLPAARAEDNPWPLWPRVAKTDYGQQEAIAVFGADPRRYQVTLAELHGEAGRVSAVSTVEVDWQRQAGGLVPVQRPQTLCRRPAQLVLNAMGFTGPERPLIEALGLATDRRGCVAAEAEGHDAYKTSLAGVFTAGDMRRGPSLVVWALQEGRAAAAACHAWLKRRATKK